MKRYYYTKDELRGLLAYGEEEIEHVHEVTSYEQDQDANLKDVDVVITTVFFDTPPKEQD